MPDDHVYVAQDPVRQSGHPPSHVTAPRPRVALIPWRVKNFVSEHFPLLYHLAVNGGRPGNTAAHWDAQLKQSWNDPARDWPTKYELIARLLRTDDTILDVGCGTGGMLRDLQRRGFINLNGLEISRYAIDRLRSEGIRMHHGALPDIALPEASVDVVIASQVLEHIVRRRRFMKQLERVLKPGGRAFIFVPDDCLGPIDEPEHVTKFNARSLRTLLQRRFLIHRLESIRDAQHSMPVLFALIERPEG